MSETLEQQLISAFSTAWNEAAPSLLERPSTLALRSLREVSGDGMSGALAVAMTWSSAFAAPCSGALSGVLICLLKSEDGDEIDKLAKQPTDGIPKPGGRALVSLTLEGASAHLASNAPAPVTFGAVTHIDLTAGESRLAAIVGDAAWVGTFTLSVGDELNTQALLIYAPNGSLDFASPQAHAATQTDAAAGTVETILNTPSASTPPPPTPQPSPSRRIAQRREEAAPRNIERLLEVELDVVVRFGVTSVPLRDVVRMGTGSMIELNRAVDEPVELLVNGRPLARGEVVVVDGYYGVRITEIGAPAERALSLF